MLLAGPVLYYCRNIIEVEYCRTARIHEVVKLEPARAYICSGLCLDALRCSSWSLFVSAVVQVEYAAMDVWVALRLYQQQLISINAVRFLNDGDPFRIRPQPESKQPEKFRLAPVYGTADASCLQASLRPKLPPP